MNGMGGQIIYKVREDFLGSHTMNWMGAQTKHWFSSVFWFLVYETLCCPIFRWATDKNVPKYRQVIEKFPDILLDTPNDIIIIPNGWSASKQSFVKNCTFQPKWTHFDRFDLGCFVLLLYATVFLFTYFFKNPLKLGNLHRNFFGFFQKNWIIVFHKFNKKIQIRPLCSTL